MKKITLDYYEKGRFEFIVEEHDEMSVKGKFADFGKNKVKLKCIDSIADKDNEQPWYLDSNGNRLEDGELLEKSPWSIVENGNKIKIVQRLMNYENGEAVFCTQPWFRIGDIL